MSGEEKDEMNQALDKLGLDVEDPAPVVDDHQPDVVEPKDNPPGFKTYDEWVADGGDPDEWQGKKKYEDHYNLIQDTKSLKSEVKSMNDLLRTTVEATTEMNKREYERGMAEAKRELDQAMEAEDVTAVAAAKDKIAELKPPKEPTAPQVNPVHAEFFQSLSLIHI